MPQKKLIEEMDDDELEAALTADDEAGAAADDDDDEDDDTTPSFKEKSKMKKSEMDEELERLEKELGNAEETEFDEETLAKALERSPLLKAMQERLTKAESVAKAATDRAEALEKAAAQRNRLTKAATLAEDLPGVEATDVALLLSKCEGDPDAVKALETVLAKASALVEHSGLFAPRGSSQVQKSDAVLLRKAADLRKANPKLTVEQSIADALEGDDDYESGEELDAIGADLGAGE